MIYSSYQEDNSELIKEAAELYLRPGMVISDPTYGRGVFWKKIDLSKYKFLASDIETCPKAAYDFRKLPYEDKSIDAVVFDPPYVHNPGDMLVNDNYKNKETTKGFYHDDIKKLYFEGMCEAERILKDEGFLWIKCKDEIESGFQRWSHIELYNLALKLGFYAKDLFILTQKIDPVIQIKIQLHARKNHSYLWIFKKPNKKEKKFLRQQIIKNGL